MLNVKLCLKEVAESSSESCSVYVEAVVKRRKQQPQRSFQGTEIICITVFFKACKGKKIAYQRKSTHNFHKSLTNISSEMRYHRGQFREEVIKIPCSTDHHWTRLHMFFFFFTHTAGQETGRGTFSYLIMMKWSINSRYFSLVECHNSLLLESSWESSWYAALCLCHVSVLLFPSSQPGQTGQEFVGQTAVGLW